jgi:hypothetical protein
MNQQSVKSAGFRSGQTGQGVPHSQNWERRCEALRIWLCTLAKEFIAGMEHVHWVSGGNDEGTAYCREHVTAEVQKLQAANPDKSDDFRIGGGYYRSEEDTVATCEKCGKTLLYSLTRYGVSYELDHFESQRLTFADLKKYPSITYQVAEILDSGRTYLESDNEPELAARLKAFIRRLEAIQFRSQGH